MVGVGTGVDEEIGFGLCLGTLCGLKDVFDVFDVSSLYLQETWVNDCLFGQMSH
jgi:hypothetical protein